MGSYSEEYVNAIISKVAITCNLLDYKFTMNHFDIIGQNYFGELIPVILRGDASGKELELHLVLKLAPTDERFRVSGALTLFFSREIFVYSVLFKAYAEIQFDSDPCLHFVAPYCCYVNKEYCKEAIVIEDMRFRGYKLYTEMFLDYEHIVVSLIALARLHALSYLLKLKDTQIYEEVISICVPLNPETNMRFMQILEDRLDKAVLQFKGTKFISMLQDFRKDYVKYVKVMVDSVNGVALCHGDIWKENILFQYENGEPKTACLIDYQTARISSPAFDVLFLIMTSTNSTVRKQFKNLINIYYEAFQNMFNGSKDKNVYCKENFLIDLKLCCPGSFIVANTAIWLSSGMQQEGHVRSRIVCNSEEDRNKAAETYKNRVSSVLDDFIELEYLSL